MKLATMMMKFLSCVFLAFLYFNVVSSAQEPELSSARVVFQTDYGDIEFGFYPSVAPKTVDHIFKLVRLGCYNTNHFFRVDKGFVAQVADVVGGRSAPMNEEQRREAAKTVVGEFSHVKHVRGILSMGRYVWNPFLARDWFDIMYRSLEHEFKNLFHIYLFWEFNFYPRLLVSFCTQTHKGYDDPDSASSSFSMLLGDAPHLDGKYAVFGKLTKGDETLRKLEEVPTHRQGMFVMPKERITIHSSYYYDSAMESCEDERSMLKRRLAASAIEIERQRMKCFP